VDRNSGLERGAATAGLLGLGIDDFKSCMSEFVFIIESACFEEGSTFGGDKKAGPIMHELFIGGLGQRNGHSVRGTGTTALFDEEAKAAGGIPLGGELDNLMSSPIG